jgi:alpha,alpha-trehalase
MNKWNLVYEGFDPDQEGLRESLCALGNGYFVTRGAAPESAADEVHYPGTYLAGGYNRLKTEIAGRVAENEDLVNLPNWLSFSFRIGDDDWFDLRKVGIISYRQELNLREGLLTRTVRFRDAKDRCTTLTQRRFVHMGYSHLAGLETTWLAENWSGRMEIRSALDGRVINSGVPRYRNLNGKHLVPIETASAGGDTIHLKMQTSQSELRIAQTARTRLFKADKPIELPIRITEETDYIDQQFEVKMAAGQMVRAEKIIALFTSRDRAIAECGLAAREAVAGADGFAALLQSHAQAWQRLWDRFDMELEFATPAAEQHHVCLILRLHIFHLLQTASPHTLDLDAGVPARGWHGEAYRGHVFWDELFIFPLLNLRIPDITRALLRYRHRRLEAARRNSRAAGHAGAMFPWQSGSDGREETQVVHLNPKSGRWLPDHSQLQRHVNAAIVYNIWHYYQVSGDLEFLCFHGSEMILEIARFLASLATWNAELGRYEILGVMGPDEYHDVYPGAEKPGLNNSAYSNLMAVWVLCRALDLVELLPAEHCSRVRQKLDVSDDEIRRWDDISRKMRLVFQADGILSQFEGYGDLKEFDWKTYREKYGWAMRLDRILEAEGDTPNNYKASKQADMLMLLYLFSAEELRELFTRLGYDFDPQMIPKNIEYYLPRTANGSTLSEVVNAWVLARSDRARSWALFTEALQSDFADVQGGTTREGIHLGAMAGTVDLIQRCYLGIETRQEVLWLNPQLPDELKRLRLRIRYRQASLCLDANHETLKVRVEHCPIEPVCVGFGERVMELKEDETVDLNLVSPKAPAEPAEPLAKKRKIQPDDDLTRRYKL